MFKKNVGLGAGALLAALCALAVSGVAGTALARDPCTIYWTGATDSAWETASNWAANEDGSGETSGPTGSDFVCLASTVTTSQIVVSSDYSATVAGLDVPAAVHFDLQGNLSVGSAGHSEIGDLTLSGWLQGAATEGAATGVKVTVTTNLSVAGGVVQDMTLENQGTATEAPDSSFTLYSATFENSGDLVLNDGGTIDGEGGTLANNSRGQIRYTGSGGTSSISFVSFTNDGSLNSSGGTLDVSNSLTNLSDVGSLSGGSYAATSGGTIQLPGDISAIAALTSVSVDATSQFIDPAGGPALNSLTSNAGSVFSEQPLPLSSLANSGTFELLATGTSTFSGPVTNSGYFEARALTLNGNFDNGAGGTFQVEVSGSGGSSVGDYGNVSATGSATLGGTLDLPVATSCPSAGTQITILSAAGGVTGTFSAVNLDTNSVDCHFGVSYTSTSVILTSGATSAPTNRSSPAISGAPSAGTQLTCNNGSWSPTPTSFAYQWNRDGSPISGATSQMYTVQPADQGHALTCTVTAFNGSTPGASITSSAINVPAAIVPASTSAPTVIGVSPRLGLPHGGTTVTITGSHLIGANAVDFGSTAAKAFTVTSDGQIIATSPAGTGTVDVTVHTPGGTSAASSADRFTYIPQVVITTVNAVLSAAVRTVDQINPAAAAKHGSFPLQVKVSTPGTLTLSMIAGQNVHTALDAQIARLVKKGTVLARGKVVARHAGKVKVTMKLTAAGKKVLRSLSKALPVQLTANFLTPQGISYTTSRGARCRPRHHASNVR